MLVGREQIGAAVVHTVSQMDGVAAILMQDCRLLVERKLVEVVHVAFRTLNGHLVELVLKAGVEGEIEVAPLDERTAAFAVLTDSAVNHAVEDV